MSANASTSASSLAPTFAGDSSSWIEERDALLNTMIPALGLKIEGTRLAPLVAELYRELEAAGIKFKPKVYLTDEWGCPEAVPIVGVPFYLADARLTRIEDEMMEGVEAETDQEIMSYLRHEVGHALNYAFKLYEVEKWLAMFGPYSSPYLEEYRPNPFSRNFVRHIPGWYAQKHPDEDFAETFAVWLTPGSDWRQRYESWGCFQKLLFVDELVREIGGQNPLVSGEDYDHSHELNFTLREYYQKFRQPLVEVPAHFDNDLKDIFAPMPVPDTYNMRADHFIAQHRREVIWYISHWTGLHEVWVRSLLNHFIERCKGLRLFVDLNKSREVLTELTTYSTTLCMNKLYKDEFVLK